MITTRRQFLWRKPGHVKIDGHTYRTNRTPPPHMRPAFLTAAALTALALIATATYWLLHT